MTFTDLVTRLLQVVADADAAIALLQARRPSAASPTLAKVALRAEDLRQSIHDMCPQTSEALDALEYACRELNADPYGPDFLTDDQRADWMDGGIAAIAAHTETLRPADPTPFTGGPEPTWPAT